MDARIEKLCNKVTNTPGSVGGIVSDIDGTVKGDAENRDVWGMNLKPGAIECYEDAIRKGHGIIPNTARDALDVLENRLGQLDDVLVFGCTGAQIGKDGVVKDLIPRPDFGQYLAGLHKDFGYQLNIRFRNMGHRAGAQFHPHENAATGEILEAMQRRTGLIADERYRDVQVVKEGIYTGGEASVYPGKLKAYLDLLAFLNQRDINVAAHLICGDTSSDIEMLEWAGRHENGCAIWSGDPDKRPQGEHVYVVKDEAAVVTAQKKFVSGLPDREDVGLGKAINAYFEQIVSQ
ncbi:MAG: hypothetical protein EOR16_31020 [Mesorhizobium sp.]|uniref:hypothetical protein n=1 Tax=Mesorhizobium sp. TaxID=1871066 RepID=UPI000FEA82E0|nr:hypothetical protein [Mesorhizobium sp.]RWI50087.1 MAG: hypothetical protein EOR16_31020 [Mesorhizobium sp.]